MRLLIRVLLAIILIPASLWAVAALWIDGPSPQAFATAISGIYALAVIVVLWRVRPFRRALLLLAIGFVAVAFWWFSIPARNDRIWLPDVSRLPGVERDGSKLTFHNVRNFHYKTSDSDYEQNWETRTVDLDHLKGLDMFISFWGPTLYAHTIMSWEFDNAPPLAISIETRKEKGEDYSALLGFFRQYELYYVVADERDVIGVRTRFRGEHDYLYRLKTGPEGARNMLLDYVKSINELRTKPAWYNALTTNCTTVIYRHVKTLAPTLVSIDWRLLANGYLDQWLYEQGKINTSKPFPEIRRESEVTDKAKAAGDAPDFAARIREGLPARPPIPD